MRIAGVLKCSFVNGEGARYVVFCQGCPHHCPGCHNPETWDNNAGVEMSPAEIAEDFKKRRMLDGITISGGEPFAQQDACVELLRMLPGVNVWIYTGYELDQIQDTELAQMADVIVTGRYVEELRCDGKMYGSSNQKVIRRNRNG